MKVKYIYLICFFIVYSMFNNFIPEFEMKGTYANMNFKHSIFHPQVEDTLILFGDNEFFSPIHGYGKYEISHSVLSTEIDFNGSTESSFSLNTSVYRSWFGKPCIWMFVDLNHHYEKISSNEKIDRSKIEYRVTNDKIIEARMKIEMDKIQKEFYDNK